MSIELAGISILWFFLYGYLIVASIDFGAGFYQYHSEMTGTRHILHGLIERYLSPVWEVTNVFLIFFMVGIIGFFPDTAYYYGTALLVPGSIAVVLLAIRGSYYAFNTYGRKQSRFYMFLYGATGLLIPASLSIVLTLSEGGFITVDGGKVSLDEAALLTSPYAWSVVLLSIVSVLYISSMFLTWYADKAADDRALQLLRKYALVWGPPTILGSLLVFFSLRAHNSIHYSQMQDTAWMFVLSFLCFLVGYFLLWNGGRYGMAFIMVMLQFFLAFFGYGASHLPYLLYPYLTVTDHFTNETMALALTGAFAAGLLLLVPSLILLLRLFLFNAQYVEGRRTKQ